MTRQTSPYPCAATVALRLALALLFFLAVLPGCNQSKLIDPDAVRPAGAVETGVPPDLSNALLSGNNTGEFWLRGYTYPEGWRGFVQAVDVLARAQGYRPFSRAKPGLEATLRQWGIKQEDYILDYSSADDKYLIEIVNLELRRAHGRHEEGTAQFAMIGDSR